MDRIVYRLYTARRYMTVTTYDTILGLQSTNNTGSPRPINLDLQDIWSIQGQIDNKIDGRIDRYILIDG